MHRPSLGIIAFALLVGGTALLVRPVEGDTYLGAVTLRSGLVLGAIWLALPNLRRIPRRVLYGIAVVAGVLIFRPRLILYALPVAAMFTVASRWSRKEPS